MITSNKIYVFGLLLAFIAGSCSSNTDDSPVVVEYKSEQLSQNQLNYFMPQNLSQADSTRFADHYIKQWVKKQAVCDVALQENEKLAEEIEFKVNDYRQKLIIHEYTSKLIRDSLDTNVPETEIATYYEQFKQDFVSKEDQYSFFHLVTASQSVSDASKWMRSNDPADFEKLYQWGLQNALQYKLDSAFVNGKEVEKVEVGYFGNLKSESPGKLIRWNGVIQGQRRRYLFKMLEVVKQGQSLPLKLCREQIRRIIINERKINLIEDVEDKILSNARANNYIKD